MSFRANGKLLLTSEYGVLDGALALALPTHLGQRLEVDPQEDDFWRWESYDADKSCWFSADIAYEDFSILNSTDLSVAVRLTQILAAVKELGGEMPQYGALIQTRLDFPRLWGLGTSSTLISLLAQWAKVDPYLLLEKTFGGSGYDIACATAEMPLIYQNKTANTPRRVEEVLFRPSFSPLLYFVYLGKKQDSREGIRRYRAQMEDGSRHFTTQLSIFTRAMLDPALTLNDFERLIAMHEEIVAETLQLRRAKDWFFSDYWGEVKSLGAWGGDFVLVTSSQSAAITRAYFNNKGFDTVLEWDDLIL